MRNLLRRRWFWLGMAFIVIAIAAGQQLIPFANPRISQAVCEKIREGMTESDVEELIGAPAGDYTTGPVTRAPCLGTGYVVVECETRKEWISDQGAIVVRFDQNKKVVLAQFSGVTRINESLLSLIRRRLHLD
jgi:hypothetical protein